MKILLLGKTGLLGSQFLEVFLRENLNFTAPDREELDLLDFEAVQDFLDKNGFDRIVLCAAYTDVDQAETEKEECEKMNVQMLENLMKSEVPIVHFSTDYVFPHTEHGTELPEGFERKPLNFYGKTKGKAEELLENSDIDFWNIRTSWLFGPGRRNFVSTISELAKNRTELKIIHDQIGRPTYTPDLAEFVTKHFIKNTQVPGHYHLQNTGPPVSWADFAEHFLEKTGWEGEIEKISSDDWNAPAKRPKNSVLKNTKINDNLRDWRDAVQEYLKQSKDKDASLRKLCKTD